MYLLVPYIIHMLQLMDTYCLNNLHKEMSYITTRFLAHYPSPSGHLRQYSARYCQRL